MKKHFTLSLLSLLVFAFSAIGQDLPIYNQFYFNPYLYNPGFVGLNGQFEGNLTFRKQWADVSDAPQVTAFNFQYATENRVALGVSFQSESTVALVTNTAYVTFGYKVPLGAEHFIQFGLSAGVLQNNLDFQELVNSSDASILEDPALLNAVDNTMFFTSQFGVNYTYHNLTLGLAFPKLFENNVNSTESFNSPSFDEFSQFIVSGSYLFDISPDFQVQPVALLRYVNRDQFQAEATALVRYNDFIWAGAGYRYESGAIGHVGLDLLNGLQLGYSYEFTGINSNAFGGGSHEVHLKWRLKRKKKEEPISEVIDNTPVVEPVAPQETQQDEEEVEEEVVEEPVRTSTTQREPETPVEEKEEPVTTNEEERVPANNSEQVRKVSGNTTGMAPGYYVIVGAFANVDNANRHQKDVAAANYDAQIAYNSENGMHYVYVAKSNDSNVAQIKRREIRSKSLFDFKNGWVLHVE